MEPIEDAVSAVYQEMIDRGALDEQIEQQMNL